MDEYTIDVDLVHLKDVVITGEEGLQWLINMVRYAWGKEEEFTITADKVIFKKE